MPDDQSNSACEDGWGSVYHCGSCGTVCENEHGGTACSNGVCTPTCDSGWADCNGNPNDGCETSVSDILNCGSCGNNCVGGNASWGCEGGVCTATQCSIGFCDLDQVENNGCEYDLDTDPSCADYVDLGSISGDEGGSIQISEGLGEAWYRLRVDETNQLLSDLGITVTLEQPDGSDMDLYLYRDSAGTCTTDETTSASFNSGAEPESAHLSWQDNWGSQDDRHVYIWVKFFSANTCATWTLTITGDQH